MNDASTTDEQVFPAPVRATIPSAFPLVPKSAIDATLAERGARYGSYEDQAMVEQRIKRAFRNAPNWENLALDQASALEMIAVKISRILTGDPNYADSWHDGAGYFTLVDRRLEAEQNASL